MPVVGAASALAEGAADVELAGKAEIATAAKLEVLVPWVQASPDAKLIACCKETRSPSETLPPGGWRNHEPSPQKGECKQEVLPQKRECESA